MTTAIDVIDRLTAKPKRAKEHISEFDDTCDVFFNNAQYEVTFADDPNAGDRTYYLAELPVIPLKLTTMVGDILQNLRSSLDHMAWHIFTVSGGIGNERDIYFPIAETLSKYEAAKKRICAGWSSSAVTALDSIKPYKGGNDILWNLHELNNLDKHRFLLRLGTVCVAQSMPPQQKAEVIRNFVASNPSGTPPDLSNTLVLVSSQHILEKGDSLGTVPKSELEPKIYFHLDMAFRIPNTVRCETVTETLNDMANLVLKIILDFSKNGLL